MGHCRIHGSYDSSSGQGCSQCESDLRYNTSVLEEMAANLSSVPKSSFDQGDYTCPHCRYKSLRRSASICPACRSKIGSDFWERIGREEAQQRERNSQRWAEEEKKREDETRKAAQRAEADRQVAKERRLNESISRIRLALLLYVLPFATTATAIAHFSAQIDRKVSGFEYFYLPGLNWIPTIAMIVTPSDVRSYAISIFLAYALVFVVLTKALRRLPLVR